MADPFDILSEPDQQTYAAALQDALRRRAATGALIQGVGGRRLGPIGAGMVRSADVGLAQQADFAQQAQGQRLRLAMDALKAQQDQAQFDKREANVDRRAAEHDAATVNAARVAAGQKVVEQKRAGDKDALDTVLKLQNALRGEPTYDNTQKVYDAAAKVYAASDNAAGDLSLIFGYMKLLDPGSTVREGEFANAQNAAGIPDRVRNLYNRAMSGTRLGTQQRSEFLGETDKIVKAQADSMGRIGNQYRATAKGLGVDPALVVFDLEPPKRPGLAPVAGGDAKAARAARVAQLKGEGKGAAEILATLKAEGLAQ